MENPKSSNLPNGEVVENFALEVHDLGNQLYVVVKTDVVNLYFPFQAAVKLQHQIAGIYLVENPKSSNLPNGEVVENFALEVHDLGNQLCVVLKTEVANLYFPFKDAVRLQHQIAGILGLD